MLDSKNLFIRSSTVLRVKSRLKEKKELKHIMHYTSQKRKK